MTNQTPLNEACTNLPQLCDQVVSDRDVVIITRTDGENVALIAADELESLLETVHLLRSPNNANRLLSTLEKVKTRTGKTQTINELKQELKIGKEG